MPEIKIFDALPEEEILAQMAEECVEASKAALKLRWVRSGVNPTPVSEKDAFENLVEELADVYLCSIVFFGGELDDNDPCNMCDDVGDNMVEIMEQKLARWKARLNKSKENASATRVRVCQWHKGKNIKPVPGYMVLAQCIDLCGDEVVDFAEYLGPSDYRENDEYGYDRVGWYVPAPGCGEPIWDIRKWMLLPEPTAEGKTDVG